MIAAAPWHGALLGTVSVYGADLVGGGFVAHVPGAIAAAEDDVIRDTCRGDVLLATTARVGATSPDVEACFNEAVIHVDRSVGLQPARRGRPAARVASIARTRRSRRSIPSSCSRLRQEEQQKPPPPIPPPQPEAQKQAPPPPPPPPPQSRPSQVVETVAEHRAGA